MFSRLERDAAGIVARLVNEKKAVHLTQEEKEILSLFIGYLYVRGPSYRQKDVNLRMALVEKPVAEIAKDPESFRADMEKAGVTFDSEEEFESMRKQFADRN